MNFKHDINVPIKKNENLRITLWYMGIYK